MPAYQFAGGVQPGVADFAVGGMMTAPMRAAQSVPAAIRAMMQSQAPDSAQDLLGNPTALRMMEQMFRQANPVFKQMQAAGRFARTTAADPNAAVRSLLQKVTHGR